MPLMSGAMIFVAPSSSSSRPARIRISRGCHIKSHDDMAVASKVFGERREGRRRPR